MSNYRNLNLLFTFLLLMVALSTVAAPPKREFYEIKIYHLKNADQEARVEAFLKDAYVPAAHRAGIKNVGVFKPVKTDTMAGKLIYVLTPLKSLDQLLTLPKTLDKDAAYTSAGKDYIDANYKNAPYARFESIILQAFTDAPVLTKPALTGPKSERVYELRSYEGHTEKIYQNKVKMFNAGGEVPLFKRLGFNAVFYGEVIAGSHMPNLMYMTTFDNKASRDAHWKSFSEDAEWNKLKVNPEYQNNVSKNTSFYLYPTEYSDI
ncbi:NIPSNAP family protein [Dyadobacter fermentans]|uniref:NIPSNAP family containing protein n=1 Tax=Dyadobacter fermentans (strain ATCC 700827 / DSM 18053 / CIP 107007 / KCTC 52180 / NS114) TaxID=471854 RepID=C6VV69_DYAFD|nr:NIPSNAP family protein [Dyadobacter fermentans]ACT94892.1 NIPSNAP family containing protein [Dyadobacter fermentans DSM 18053]